MAKRKSEVLGTDSDSSLVAKGEPKEKRRSNLWEFFKQLFRGADTPEIRTTIGSYLHHVPEATSVGQILLGLQGTGPIPAPSARGANASYERMYQYSFLACAVARRLLSNGRGNVIEDINTSQGRSKVGVSNVRGKDEPVKYIFTHKALERLSWVEINVLRAIKEKAGNCNEFAGLGYCYLRSLPRDRGVDIYRVYNKKIDHVFVFIAIPDGANPPQIIICDPWLNFVADIKDSKFIDQYMPVRCYELAKENLLRMLERGEDVVDTANMDISQPVLKDDVLALPPVADLTGEILRDPSIDEVLSKRNQVEALSYIEARRLNPESALPECWYSMEGQDFQTGAAAVVPKTVIDGTFTKPDPDSSSSTPAL